MMVNSQKSQTTNLSKNSLVAYYGKKPLALQQLIIELQQLLKDSFATNFIPYDLKQIHGTIIGCEGIKTELGIISQWFYKLRKETKYLDYYGLINYLLTTNLLPLKISFGGYKIEKDYQFYSNNQHPYYRSFQIKKSSENTFIPIVIGWSLKQQVITTELDRIRRDLQQFGYLHKYHKLPQDIDNDLYMRIGTIKSSKPLDTITIQHQVIEYLKNKVQTTVSLSKENLALVKYEDLSLPTATTKVYSLTELNNNVEMLQRLYK